LVRNDVYLGAEVDLEEVQPVRNVLDRTDHLRGSRFAGWRRHIGLRRVQVRRDGHHVVLHPSSQGQGQPRDRSGHGPAVRHHPGHRNHPQPHRPPGPDQRLFRHWAQLRAHGGTHRRVWARDQPELH
jgi:hypothetical protein